MAKSTDGTLDEQKPAAKKRKRLSKQEEIVDEPPENRPGLLLSLTADMYRQHASLFQQQAAVLERVAVSPNNPLSWQLEEPSPESIQDSLHQENVTMLAIKAYQSMLQVQKRVDYLERLMLRNGIGQASIVKSRPNTTTLMQTKSRSPTDPFYWFLQEHAPRVAESIGESAESEKTHAKVVAMWKNTNPAQRQPYQDRTTASSSNEATGLDAGERRRLAKRSKGPKDDDATTRKKSDVSHSESEEEKPLFRKLTASKPSASEPLAVDGGDSDSETSFSIR